MLFSAAFVGIWGWEEVRRVGRMAVGDGVDECR